MGDNLHNGGKMLKCLVCDRDIEERSGKERRKGIELTGVVHERYPEGAKDDVYVWRVRGTLAWAQDRRNGKDRREAK